MNVSSSCPHLIRHGPFSVWWYWSASAGAIFQHNFHIYCSIQTIFWRIQLFCKNDLWHISGFNAEALSIWMYLFGVYVDTMTVAWGGPLSPTSHYRVTVVGPNSSFKQSTSSSCCQFQSQIAMLCVAPGNPRLRTSMPTGGCLVNHPLEQCS